MAATAYGSPGLFPTVTVAAPDTTDSLTLLVECGAGVICVCGPRGVGKTTAVLRCVSDREVRHGARVAIVSAHSLTQHLPGGGLGPGAAGVSGTAGGAVGSASSSLSLLVTTGSGANSGSGVGGAHSALLSECYRQFAVALAGQNAAVSVRPTPYLAGAAIRHAMGDGSAPFLHRSHHHHHHHHDDNSINNSSTAAPFAARVTAEALDAALLSSAAGASGGFSSFGATAAVAASRELHLVLDDAGHLPSTVVGDIAAWAASLGLPRTFLWVVSSTPVAVNGCWRYKFMTRPDVRTVASWIASRLPSRDPLGAETLAMLGDVIAGAKAAAAAEAATALAGQKRPRGSDSDVEEHFTEGGGGSEVPKTPAPAARHCSLAPSQLSAGGGLNRGGSFAPPNPTTTAPNAPATLAAFLAASRVPARRIASAVALKETDVVMSRAAEAATYFLSHNPMRSSIVARDVRTLMRAVYRLADELALTDGLAPAPISAASEGLTAVDKRGVSVASAATQHSASAGRCGSVATPHRQKRLLLSSLVGPAVSAVSPSTAATDPAARRAAILGTGGGDAARRPPNALAYSTAWSRLCVAEDLALTTVRLPQQVARLGPSAQLLCIALFYCGTVAPSRDQEVFREMGAASRGPARLRRQGAAKDTVISSATHAISSPRLWAVYGRLPRMIDVAASSAMSGASSAYSYGTSGAERLNSYAHLRPSMCLDPSAALHHLGSLAAWGALTTGHSGLHTCHLTVEDAREIGAPLGIDVLLLIPTKR